MMITEPAVATFLAGGHKGARRDHIAARADRRRSAASGNRTAAGAFYGWPGCGHGCDGRRRMSAQASIETVRPAWSGVLAEVCLACLRSQRSSSRDYSRSIHQELAYGRPDWPQHRARPPGADNNRSELARGCTCAIDRTHGGSSERFRTHRAMGASDDWLHRPRNRKSREKRSAGGTGRLGIERSGMQGAQQLRRSSWLRAGCGRLRQGH